MRRLLLSAGLLLAITVFGSVWLTSSDSGLQASLRLAAAASGGRLQVEQASGRLSGPLQIARLHWQSPGFAISLEGLQLDWQPAALLGGRLHIAALSVDRLHVVSPPTDEPASPPETLLLPLAVDITRLTVGTLTYGGLPEIRHIAARLSSDGRQHRLTEFAATFADVAIRAEAGLDGAAPLPLTASAALTGRLAEHPLALELQANGPLSRIDVALLARQGISGQASGVLTPFADAPFANARVRLADIDPAAWQAGAPSARLALEADFAPQGDAIGGSFALRNPQTGPLDRQRLPLSSLGGQFLWQEDGIRFSELAASLNGQGTLRGSGRWQDDTLSLAVDARQLDAARIVGSLRPTRLDGSLRASLGADRQQLAVDLRDAQFTIRGEASQQDGTLALTDVELAAGNARLTLAGELALAGERRFSARGTLERFDPSRFARLPAAQINATFAGSGRLGERPQIDASFALADSRLAGHPLTGDGRLQIDWPKVPHADIRLSAGANRLHAAGAFGRPGDRLTVVIDAPELDPYGVAGSLAGQLELAGSLQQPALAIRLNSPRLVLPGFASLRDLALRADFGAAPEAPLQADLRIGQLDTGEPAARFGNLHFQATGSNQAHRWQLAGELAGRQRLTLAASGSLTHGDSGPHWRGRLLEGALLAPDPARNLRLAAPADLHFGTTAWAFGPARLAGDPLDWQASLQAGSDGRTLQASLSARGSRIGRIDGQLTAAMQGAWALDRQAPWQGRAESDIADLAWLGELLGDGWQSAGRFRGELQLAGTPAQPLTSGRLRGDRLAVRHAGQALDLRDGELAVDVDANLLRIRQLHFASHLQAAPRALRLAERVDMASLTARPGRVELSGEMRLGGSQGSEEAFLDFRLERLGASQLPEQWVMLSGAGRLSWNGETLGLGGRLNVDAGYWQLAPGGMPRLSDDVVVRRTGEVQTPTALRPKLELDLVADLGRNFLFAGAGLSSRLSGELRLRASGRDLPRASGSIRLRDGRFDAYGQRLAIRRGILSFQGLLDNPALDVLAVRQGLPVEPGVQISGTAQRPVIRLVSDPELPEAEKLAWLVLGHGPESMGAGDATLLLSAAGGLLGNDSGKLVEQLQKTFGFDELAVRQGEVGSTGGRQIGSRVAGSSVDTTGSTGGQILSIGKRLGANALLSYEQALGRAEGIVKLTVNLNRQISVIGRAGSDNALDIFYTLSFGRPAEIRRPLPPTED